MWQKKKSKHHNFVNKCVNMFNYSIKLDSCYDGAKWRRRTEMHLVHKNGKLFAKILTCSFLMDITSHWEYDVECVCALCRNTFRCACVSSAPSSILSCDLKHLLLRCDLSSTSSIMIHILLTFNYIRNSLTFHKSLHLMWLPVPSRWSVKSSQSMLNRK